MRRFYWLGAELIDAGADLRALGWAMVRREAGALPDCPVLVDCRRRPSAYLPDYLIATLGLGDGDGPWRRWLILLGITHSEARARLLAQGFGDALTDGFSRDELAARAERVASHAVAIAPTRHFAGLQLDLLAREAYAEGTPLGLHPREFALLWRLMDEPGRVVDKHALLHDVWHRQHMPETNSIAVHASRLRSKLALAGFSGMLRSAPSGGYFLDPSERESPRRLLATPRAATRLKAG